jgi:hypothetical protein
MVKATIETEKGDMRINAFMVYTKDLIESSPIWFRVTCIVYMSISLIMYVNFIYNDGVSALLAARHAKGSVKMTNRQEIEVIRSNLNGCRNFWECLIWPYTAMNRIVPVLILILNPPDKTN